MKYGVWDVEASAFVEGAFGQALTYGNVPDALAGAQEFHGVFPGKHFCVYLILPSGKPYLGDDGVTVSVDDILNLSPHDHNLLPH